MLVRSVENRSVSQEQVWEQGRGGRNRPLPGRAEVTDFPRAAG